MSMYVDPNVIDPKTFDWVEFKKTIITWANKTITDYSSLDTKVRGIFKIECNTKIPEMNIPLTNRVQFLPEDLTQFDLLRDFINKNRTFKAKIIALIYFAYPDDTFGVKRNEWPLRSS